MLPGGVHLNNLKGCFFKIRGMFVSENIVNGKISVPKNILFSLLKEMKGDMERTKRKKKDKEQKKKWRRKRRKGKRKRENMSEKKEKCKS